jgi:serine/threonine protein kinase
MSSGASRLGRYQIVKHLASGGMADVVIARTTGMEGFERHVVVKRIRAEQARDKHYVEMFLDEARLAASLHHGNVVQVNDIGQDDGEYFFAMEYVHGEDVRKILTVLNGKGEQMPLQHVITIVASAAAGLHHAHEHRGPDGAPLNIVHRDVSPANILVGYDGGVKVADFGIAKAAARIAETRSGTLKGKVSYMSPEQCIGSEVDRRSDLFALGVVLYELATVRRLFKGSSDFLTMSAIVQGNVPPPSACRPDIPPVLDEVIMKALSARPDDRYQTAAEMRSALDSFAEYAGLRTSTMALSAYMHELCGERPEPWLVPDDAAGRELSVDFDGTNSGLVGPPLEAIRHLTLPPEVAPQRASPIVKARTKAITDAPPLRAPTPVPVVAGGWNADDKAPTTASGTPMAWTPVPQAPPEPAPPRRRWPGIMIGVVATLVIGGGGLVATGAFQSKGNRTPAVAPAAEVAPVTMPTTSPAPPPAPPPGPTAIGPPPDAAVLAPPKHPGVKHPPPVVTPKRPDPKSFPR